MVFTSAPGVLPEQNDRYRIQPCKVNEIKAYKKKEKRLHEFNQNLWTVKGLQIQVPPELSISRCLFKKRHCYVNFLWKNLVYVPNKQKNFPHGYTDDDDIFYIISNCQGLRLRI